MVTFADLWRNHPSNQNPPDNSPCSGGHENQCCIRLGASLVRSGVSLISYRGVFCWSRHGREHPLRVEEMKVWLNSASATFIGSADIARRSRHPISHTDYAGRTGIVACRNFWGRNNQGDHIDLWDGSNIAHGDPSYFSRAEEVWFWELA